MSGGLKSSLDVALKRMEQIVGDEAVSLTDDQKKRIAAIKREHEAKAAEKKIMCAPGEEVTAELQRLLRERDEKIKAVYAAGV